MHYCSIVEELISMISRENNLFLVGDVKQSIYKFRLAEPEIFEKRYRRYEEGDISSEKIDLNQNFRSKKPVIDFINYIFTSLLEGYDDNAKLKLGAQNGEDSKYEPKLYLTEVPWDAETEIDDELKNLKKAEKEALACVKIINDYLGKPFYDNGVLRPLKKSDIVILMRGIKGYGDIFYHILMENNIPAVMTLLKHIYNNIMYAELNTKSDYCQECGYDGEIEIVKDESGKLIWKCPKCGNTDEAKLNVARRTCGYIGSQFWNQGRTQEIKERVLHVS